jgi:hypothetical protein
LLELIKELAELKDTPVPVVMVASGIIFLLLALAGGFSGSIDIPIQRQKWAGFIGSLFLIIGIALYILPTPFTLPTTGVITTSTPTQTNTPTPTNTPTLTNTNTPTPSNIPNPTDTLTPTNIPTATFTKTPSNTPTCSITIGIGQEVRVLEDARIWTQPDVTVGSVYLTLSIGDSVNIINGPVLGRISLDQNISGLWWEVSDIPNGDSLGWIWEDRITMVCD